MDSIKRLINKANKLIEHDQLMPAADCFRTILKQTTKTQLEHVMAIHNLGVVYEQGGDLAQAEKYYRQAISISPEHIQSSINLASLLFDSGELGQAKTLYRRVLELQPNNIDAHFAYSKLVSYNNNDPTLAALQQIGRQLSKFPLEQQIKVCFTIGKVNQDIGDYENAFAAFQAGNHLHYQRFPYDLTSQCNLVDDVMAVFNEAFFERFKPRENSSDVSIFILGMPRSGSTLIEQILASHTQVAAAGELKYLKQSVQTNLIKDRRTFSNAVTHWDSQSLQKTAGDYQSILKQHDAEGLQIIDKMPGNYLLIGLIYLLFPKAKIIHTERHPIATCWSNYSTLFGDALHYTYQLDVLGQYYNKYRQLMQHWRKMLPNHAFYDVSYEAMVADSEKQIRALLDYLQLPWEKNCLQFYKTKRIIKTASVTQVRQPVYSSSLDIWKNYQTHLIELQKLIAPRYRSS